MARVWPGGLCGSQIPRPSCLFPEERGGGPDFQPHAEAEREAATEHLRTRGCESGETGPQVSGRWDEKECQGAAAPLWGRGGGTGRVRTLPNGWKSHSQASLRFPSQDARPGPWPSRTMWPSLGNALWAGRGQVMLCFHGDTSMPVLCGGRRTRVLNK